MSTSIELGQLLNVYLVLSQGSMEGEYTMVLLSEEDGQWAESIEVG